MTTGSLTGLVTRAAELLAGDTVGTAVIGALTLGLIGLLWYLSQEDMSRG